MLLLTFSIGSDTFGLDVRQVLEVVPMPVFKALPRAPDYVAGLFNYRGTVVPVIDLCRLATDRACLKRMSSRVIIVDYPVAKDQSRPLGLLAEKVTKTIEAQEARITDPVVTIPDAPYLGQVVNDAGEGLSQIIDIKALLPADVRDMLFTGDNGDEDQGDGQGEG